MMGLRVRPFPGKWGRCTGRILLWMMILAGCLLLEIAVLEGMLRWMGTGHTTRFLLRKEINGAAWYVPNRAFYQQFSSLPLDRILSWDELDFQVPEIKAPGSFRIVVLGSSAIFGMRSSARILEAMLHEYDPAIRWEVYIAACPGMNSHVMRAAAQACAPLQPDLFLVYMGNNEAVGPFGPTTLLGRSGWFWRPSVIHALIALNDLRIVQALRGERRTAALNLPDKDALMGMMPGMTDHHRALLYYRRNVEDICAAAEHAHARVMLCTLSGNKRYMGKVTPSEPDFNGLSINGILRELSGTLPNTRLADIDRLLSSKSEDGLPGYEYFTDNVHFNFDGNHLAATGMFRAFLEMYAPSSALPLEDARFSREHCARKLAWTEAAELEQLHWQMLAFHDDYSGERIRKRHGELFARIGDGWRDQLAGDFENALKETPDALYLRIACFKLLLERERGNRMKQQGQALLERHPAARAALRAQGQVAEALNETEAARNAYSRCVEAYPDDPEALRRLGELLFLNQDAGNARNYYERYLSIDPMDPFAQCRLGQIMEMQGSREEARQMYLAIIGSSPKHPLAYRLLDDLMAKEPSPEDRARFWDEMIQRYPEAAEPLVRRALIYRDTANSAKALDLLRRAALLAPDDPAVLHPLGETALSQGALDEAEKALREAIRLQPGDGSNRLLLIQTLIQANRLDEARSELEACDALGLNMPPEIRKHLQQ